MSSSSSDFCSDTRKLKANNRGQSLASRAAAVSTTRPSTEAAVSSVASGGDQPILLGGQALAARPSSSGDVGQPRLDTGQFSGWDNALIGKGLVREEEVLRDVGVRAKRGLDNVDDSLR